MKTVDFRYFKLQPGDKVLDLGCGEGRHVIAAYVEAEVTAVGVDLNFADLKTASQRAADFIDPDTSLRQFCLSNANALQLPFADYSFDKVICSEVLEHIDNYQGVLKEIARVLRPGGLFCASVPRRWPEKICWRLSKAYHQVEGGHLRIFHARHLKADIQQLGFRFYRRHWAHALHSPYWWLKCLLWEQDEHFLIRHYHRFLVWDLLEKPRLSHVMEQGLNPIMGKSVVMYFQKELNQ